jgi:hypothetical protein
MMRPMSARAHRDGALAASVPAPPGRSWPRRAGLAGAAALVIALGARGAMRPGVDLEVYYRAGAHFRAATDLYEPVVMRYRYAPGLAALFVPLAAFSFPVARALWAAAGVAIGLAVTLALDRRLGGRSPWAVPAAWLLLAQPLAQELSYGQVDLLVLGLAFAAFALDDRGREAGAGALVALATALKVAPALLLVDWLARRRWRPFAGAAAAGLATLAVTALRYGFAGALELHLRWLASESHFTKYMVDSVRNQSLWALGRAAGLGSAGGAIACAALVAAVLPAERERRRLLLLAALPLVSGSGWPQFYIVAAPLVAWALAGGGAAAWIVGAAAAGVSALSYDVAGPAVERWAFAHRVDALLLTAAVVAARFAPRREDPTARPGLAAP